MRIFKQLAALFIDNLIAFIGAYFLYKGVTNNYGELFLIGLLWSNYLFFIAISVFFIKNGTVGDVLMRNRYYSLSGKREIRLRLFIRSLIGSTFIYCCWLGLHLYLMIGIVFWVYIVYVFNISQSEDFESCIDRFTEIKFDN